MDDRTKDLEQHIQGLTQALQAGKGAEDLLGRALAAELALEFRGTDAMIGLPPVDDALIERADALVGEALQRAAVAGLAEAQARFGARLLEDGEIDGALEHLAAAAEKGDPEAGRLAAATIWEGRIENRAEQAARLAAKAAPGDESGASDYLLGLFAFHGFGGAKDLKQSVVHHEAAAKKGHDGAMFELYAMISQGLGHEKDEAEALRWCEQAAEAGNVRAMYNLGAFHATGHGVPQDSEKSVVWYDQAARAGHGRAAATLGVMYALGEGVSKSEDLALTYFSLAEATGFEWQDLAEATGVDVEAYEEAMAEGEDDDLDELEEDEDEDDEDDEDEDEDEDEDDDEGEGEGEGEGEKN
ncbi:MAG TPA: tetratricopeptide repeat protein [Candidatus Nanopelagicales bacterium]|nr:tetratricopeptide repeat protein [Candidatus Nanopelagicales bacterium]